ncbi:MAG: histidine--tRNA ligase [Rhizobiaceae bacterium]|nr:histidine--tRNA ligase [Rhizobiaceae bacterium]
MADRGEKMKARSPRGFVDRTPEDIRATEAMMEKIKAVYDLYGFEPADQPIIEYTDALGKFLPDQDRPNEGVFSFRDDDEQWLSLRYDLTAPLARYVAENFEKLPKPFRSYRAGWVFRNEKPGPGRFRQFMQFDADTVGTPSVAADAEMAMMMADVMEALGISRGDYVIRVNNRKVLDGVLEAIGLGGPENAGRRLTVLRAIDKLDKFGVDGVRLLLTTGRWDGGKEGEGDFTKGAGLSDNQAAIVVSFFVATAPAQPHMNLPADTPGASNAATIAYLPKLGIENAPFVDGAAELAQIAAMVAMAGYGEDRIKIDPSVVRGLEYYTGPVFEAELLFEIPNEDGQIVRFGSVGGGGRYDGLVSRFRGEPVPATGFSIGVSRLMSALKALGKVDRSTGSGPVVVLVMDKDTDSLGRYQKMVSELRSAGIRAEMYLGGAGMKAQMKYADRRGSPVVVIQGGDERAKGEVTLKDMALGEELSKQIADNAEWREGRPAQVSVPEGELVTAVRKILDAQKAERG